MDNISIVKHKCVGCRNCEKVCPKNCISIQQTKEGFLYPFVAEKECVHCGLCLKYCPTKSESLHRNKPRTVWAFKNRNEKNIMQSASGGAADVASEIVLQQNGVVYGAAYDENFVVRHIEVLDNKERKRLQSSKYVQSDINNCYVKIKKRLAEGKTVLFTGTPCQVAGLYSFLGNDKRNLYTIDLICHGVPSPKLFRKYTEYQNRKIKGKIFYYNFRSKDKKGWGTQYLLKINAKIGTKIKTKTKPFALEPYGNHFIIGDCYRECCYQCVYSNIDRIGDITVGDFWGIANSHPDFYSPKGVSSVFVNTEKGEDFFNQMKNKANVLAVTLEEGVLKQENLVKSTVRPLSRNTFYKNIDDEKYIDKLRVGLQLKERAEALIPVKVLNFVKQYLIG